MIDLDEYLRPHQRTALEKMSNGKILRGGVGSGKTRVAIAYYKTKEAPKHVYVITTAKKRDDFDWQNEFYNVFVGPRSGPSEPNAAPRRVRGKNRNRDGFADGAGSVHSSNPQSHSSIIDSCSERDREIPPALGQRNVLDNHIDRRSGVVSENGTSNHIRGSAGVVTVGKELVESTEPRNGEVAPNEETNPNHPIWTLTVDSWNNINKYAGVEGAFFIFDEQRLVGSGQWTKAFLRISRRNHWILLSATPGDTWMDYVPVFVANNFYKNRTEFKREHVVYNTFTKFPKVDRYINVGRLVRQRAQLLVEMPYVRHTKRRHVDVPLWYDKDALDLVLKKRWHVFEDRPLRDIAEMFSVGRKVVNGDPSRLAKVCELWEKHPKLIVFYNFDYELESLRSIGEYLGLDPKTSSISESRTAVQPAGSHGRPKKSSLKTVDSDNKNESTKLMTGSTKNSEKSASGGTMSSGGRFSTETKRGSSQESSTTVSIAEWNGHKHQSIPSTKRWLYLVQYTAGAEAWECIDTDAMIFYSRNYSWKVWEQAQGRTDRLNTPFTDLWYYNFTSDSWVDRAIERSLKAKETFNVKKYGRIFSAA